MKGIIGLAVAGLFLYTGCAHVENFESKNYTPPEIKYQPKIFYPASAQENYIMGTANCMLYVDKEGRVKKVDLLKSSGYQLLDSAAESYCRDLVFTPALGDGKPIGSRVNWKVRFNISDINDFSMKFVYNMQNLYYEVTNSLPSEKEGYEQKILLLDNEFVHKSTDFLNFNSTIERVLLPKTSEGWKKDWGTYPLSFLLYFDFMQRFPEFRDSSAVKLQMLNAFKHDLKLIKNSPGTNMEKEKTREMLLLKLQKFAKDYFPEISPDEFSGSPDVSALY